MLELIAGAALIAVLFIYGTLRGIQATLQRLELHLAQTRANPGLAQQTGSEAEAWRWAARPPGADPATEAQQWAARQAAAQHAAFQQAAAQQAAAQQAAAQQAAAYQAAAQQAAAQQAAAQQAAAQQAAARQAAARREAERPFAPQGPGVSAAGMQAPGEAGAGASDFAAAERIAAERFAAQRGAMQPPGTRPIAGAEGEARRSEAERRDEDLRAGQASHEQEHARRAAFDRSPEGQLRAQQELAGQQTGGRAADLREAYARRQRAASAEVPSVERQRIAAASAAAAAPSSGDRTPIDAGPKRGFDWELFSGGRLFNIVGALALIIGVGLFFKYLFDQNVITVGWRVAGGVILGGAIVAVGHVTRTRSERTWFADGIIGTGFGTLYLSGYASFQSFHVFTFQEAYGYMSVVTLVAFALGLRYDSMGISLIGWAGGFMTPFVLGDAHQNELGLASYLIVLDLGMAAIAVVKSRWFVMQPLAMAATYIGVFAWYARNAGDVDWFVSVIALVSFWSIFFAAGIAATLRTKAFSPLGAALAGFNALLFMSYLSVAAGDHRGAFEAGLAFVAIAYAAGVRRNRAPQCRRRSPARPVCGRNGDLRFRRDVLASPRELEPIDLRPHARGPRGARDRTDAS